MNSALFLALLTSLAGSDASSQRPSLPSGLYVFEHRFAEHPDMASIELSVRIDGSHIVVVNAETSDVFPKGILAEGTLMWHEASGKWIIGDSQEDRFAKDVGGCSDGPEVVDLRKKIYWTC
jgi:hypothetical protein